MIKNDGNNEQIYGRNDMVMLNPNNKIYGSLGIADKYVLKTEEGKSLILSNPKLGKFGDVLTEFDMYGRSEQKSTTGAQLANLPNKNNVIINGVTWTSKDNVVTAIGETGENMSQTDKDIYFDVPVTAGSYYISGGDDKIKLITRIINKTGQYKFYINNASFTLIGDERSLVIYLEVQKQTSVNGSTKVMLNKGNIALPFEPYTGGIPSPSPEYPQEIKSVGDSGSIELNVMGANVLEGTKLGVKSTVNGITYATYENGILITGTATKDSFIVLHDDTIHPLTHDTYYLTTSGLNSSVSLNFYYIGKFVDDRQNLKVTLSKDVEYSLRLQISKGETVNTTVQASLTKSKITSYEPYYEEQTVTLPYTLNAIPVSSGGNVTIDGQQYIADRVVKKDGVFGIERNIREIHTNTKTMNNTERHPGWNNVKGISDIVYYNTSSDVYSRILTYISNFTQKSLCQNNKGTNNILYVSSSVIGYLQSELIAKAIDVDMHIRLQDVIFEPFPSDIQAKLRTLVTYYPVTIIENNYNTWMKATYKSIESV